MSKQSAGILVFRQAQGHIEVLLGHPGGPFFVRKDNGVWSIPKGEFADGEEPFEAAQREFTEETGVSAPSGEYLELGVVKASGGKKIHAWAVEGDVDPGQLRSNKFSIEWPPKSGQRQEFPELDRYGWFELSKAKIKLTKSQTALIERLASKLGVEPASEPGPESSRTDPEPQQTSLL